MGRECSVGLLLLAFASVSAPAADVGELKARRVRAAAAFSDGILMIHANAALDQAADGFRQDAIFYYFTGLENTIGAILAIDGRSRETWLFLPTRAPYQQSLPSEATAGSEAIKRSGIEHVADWSEFRGLLAKNAVSPIPLYYAARTQAVPDLPPNIIAPNAPRTPLWLVSIAQNWPSFQLREVGSRVRALLEVQSLSEMANVRAAALATVQAVRSGMHAIRPGVSQRNVEAEIADTCRKAGAHGVAAWPWVMAGSNGIFPRPFASLTRYDHLNAVLNAGDLVRLDVGCESAHYFGDLGRTVPVSGRYSEEQREIWNVFVAAYHAGTKVLREGVTVEHVFDAWATELLRHRGSVRHPLAQQAIDNWSKRDNVPFWQIHTLNLTEGTVSDPLRAGATIAFEPIASIGGQGYYLEDMFVITQTGSQLLTPGIPYYAEEIEKEMQKADSK